MLKLYDEEFSLHRQADGEYPFLQGEFSLEYTVCADKGNRFFLIVVDVLSRKFLSFPSFFLIEYTEFSVVEELQLERLDVIQAIVAAKRSLLTFVFAEVGFCDMLD